MPLASELAHALALLDVPPRLSVNHPIGNVDSRSIGNHVVAYFLATFHRSPTYTPSSLYVVMKFNVQSMMKMQSVM